MHVPVGLDADDEHRGDGPLDVVEDWRTLVSQPDGRLKFVAPRNVTAAGRRAEVLGHDELSHEQQRFVPRDIFRSLFRNSTSCITMPMPADWQRRAGRRRSARGRLF